MKDEIQLEHIIIEGTNVCNAACVFCPREKYKHPLQHMSMELFEKIINEALEMGIKSVGFASFGEPLCDPGLVEKIEYIKNKNKEVSIHITSTLFLLNQQLTSCFIRNVDTIHISFYGMSPEVYEKIHGGTLKFERSRENVLSLISERNKYHGKTPYIVMRYLVSELNEHQMEQFIQYWEPIADEVMVWKPHNFLYGREYRKTNKTADKSCGRPFSNVLYFDIEGRVTTCCFDFNKEMEVGNVGNESIKEILKGEKLRELRQRHTEYNYSGILCENCDQRITDPEVLVYSTESNRGVREFSMNRKQF